jgi:hypothetical protein
MCTELEYKKMVGGYTFYNALSALNFKSNVTVFGSA